MAKQAINLGASPTGAGGDDRRSAWLKAKSNFTELYNWLANVSQSDDQSTPLPAVLPLAKGGTGQNSLAALISALQGGGAYGRSNALGTVGQSGGVPTGAILEFGSNANGKYLKLADGTLICWQSSAGAYSINNAFSTDLVASSPITMTFPMAFAGAPVVMPTVLFATGYFCWAAIEPFGVSSTQCALRLISRLNTATAYSGYLAIGRWY